MSEGPLFAWRAMVRDGALEPDPMQELAAEKLQSLCHALKGYEPGEGLFGWKARLGLARRRDDPPRGLYIYGPVGRGKSMLMDMFFDAALFDRGVVVVCTSNTPPDDLYRDGLQRELFLPFIDIIKKRVDLLELAAKKDYRLARLVGAKLYHTPLGEAATAALDGIFAELTAGAMAPGTRIEVKGRAVEIPAAARGVARFHFDDLCGAALGAEDYIAIAARYHTLVLDGVPVMGEPMRNELRRFIALIDTLYDNGTRLIVAADAEPEALHSACSHGSEFKRTISRLHEMRSAAWVGKEPR